MQGTCQAAAFFPCTTVNRGSWLMRQLGEKRIFRRQARATASLNPDAMPCPICTVYSLALVWDPTLIGIGYRILQDKTAS